MKSQNVETSKSPNEGTEGASYRDQAVEFVSCAGTDGELRTVTLAPWGRTQSKNGEFVIDNEAVSEILSAFNAHSTAIPIDIEHEALDEAVPPGQRAGTVGWIEKLWGEPGKGLMGLVRWSERGRELIRSDAYRFLSPVLVIRKSDRRAVALHSAGLTTKPAIPAMERLAASEHRNTEQTKMKDQTQEGTGSMVTLVNEDAAVARAVRESLGLPADAPASAVTLALSTRQSAELVVMRQREAERAATELVAGYVKAGKLNPNHAPSMEAARQLAGTRPELLEAILSNAASVLPPQGRTTPPSDATMRLIARDRVIRDAVKTFKDYPTLAKLTTCKAHVDQALRDKELAPLTKEEVETLVV